MLEHESTNLALIENDTTINAFPNGQDDETEGEDTDSGKPDGGNQ